MTNEVRLTSEFSEWLDGLKDQRAAALVASRIERLGYGLVGDAKVFEGIGELRIDYGPGYRVYFCRRGGIIYILLCGGTKRTQERDIKRAKKMAQEIGHDH
ncbi:type II toxin-antitoxin system RelE/ParE family toxin [Chelatococcus asaccharovorans]|uniref:Putative addiction module killer protein n=1 Tax=Chelatococcus asaccharovorans TaxID=28210 RepID=A0A2V3U2N4_9HYPH|nr:type II toxin-antitoxin system RelE/ParE family toxin [Chelatococcus asaccharovorans]MBS7702702.1 type II toxin-antitoxin system RelE/ParE family toxin [Chelatococcus asaccharovorans]PXW56995.1 putative addiction module killer protein [Chelatococcus asaccharovorans]